MITNLIPIQKVDIWLDEFTFKDLVDKKDLYIFEKNNTKLIVYNGVIIGYNSPGTKYI